METRGAGRVQAPILKIDPDLGDSPKTRRFRQSPVPRLLLRTYIKKSRQIMSGL